MAKKSSGKQRRPKEVVAQKAMSLDASLDQSRAYFANGDYAAALGVARSRYELNDRTTEATNPELVQIGAWSAYRVGNFAEADKFLVDLGNTRGLGEDDALLKGLLHYEFREFGECIRTAEPLLMPLSETARNENNGMTTKAQLDLISCLAMSYYNLGELESAVNVLEEAISARDDHDEFYVNLATVKGRLGDEEGRRKVISDGLVRCGNKRELDILARDLVGNETISLCMIVKNEEALLGQCLTSARGLVNEIIVVDTGSTDGTVAIAEQFGARVYHHPWQNDFSLHRNQSLEYATGDWILILDADEELRQEDIAKLKQATRVPDMNVLSLSVHNKHVASGEITSFLPSVRMWRRKLNVRYEGIVHNELRLPVDEPILRVDAGIIHYGYGLDWELMKKKIARSKALLHKQLEENPNNYFANFNLAQILRGEHKMPPPEVCREIIEHAGRAVRNSSSEAPGQRHIHLMALDQIVSAYFHLGEYKRAEETAKQALEIDPNYLDPMFQLGHVYAASRDFARAIKAYEKYIAAADDYNPGNEITSFILIHSHDQAAAYFSLGLIHEEMKMDEKAELYFKRVLEYKSNHLDVYAHLAVLRFRQGDYDGAESYAERQLSSDRSDITAHVLLAKIKQRAGQAVSSRKHCLEILAIDANHIQALETLISLEREAGNAREALVRIDQLLAVDPTNFATLNQKAEVLIGQGQFDRATEIYSHLLAAFPNDAELWNNAGNCYFRMSDYQEAIRHYSNALAIDAQLVPALRNIGLSYFKLGDNANAAVKLSNYIDYAAEDFDVTYLVARLWFDLSNYSDALRYVEKCLLVHPRSPELVGFLADCYLKLGHIDSAKVGYERALMMNPDFAPAQHMLDEIEKLGGKVTKVGVKVQ
ncbi:MAG: tetratricopeptide repeat protein [bacterium]|nr:tetratricopeptide repeat protein [bacterium]